MDMSFLPTVTKVWFLHECFNLPMKSEQDQLGKLADRFHPSSSYIPISMVTTGPMVGHMRMGSLTAVFKETF